MTVTPQEYNERFRLVVAQIQEWVKLLITVTSALLLIGIALLKDVLQTAAPPITYVIAGLLAIAFTFLFLGLWHGLGLTRLLVSTLLKRDDELGAPEDQETLKSGLEVAQARFFNGLIAFALVAILSLGLWSIGRRTLPPLKSAPEPPADDVGNAGAPSPTRASGEGSLAPAPATREVR